MLIHSISQLLTLAGNPQRGKDLGNLSIIPDGAVRVKKGRIADVGPSNELRAAYPNENELDVGGKVVLPGFIDPHTHAIWVGDRAAEFEKRLQGKTYMEILEQGGGILSTVQATRNASLSEMVSATRSRLNDMFNHGTTTAEVKTGYGLEYETEMRMLKAILLLNEEVPLDLVPTFLGAHAIPREYKDFQWEYAELVRGTMLPNLKEWWLKNKPGNPLPFVDVFCETGAFNLKQSRKILNEAKELGFPLKIHADEFDNLGGVKMAVELGAVSADHLVTTSQEEIKLIGQSDTVAVALPCTPFGLAEPHYTPAKEFISAGGILAIATDLNPGTAWCESIQFAIALACRYMRLTPAQAIAAATINAAAAINAANRIGSIEVGKEADMIVLSVSDYRNLGYRFGINLVDKVIKKGQLYSV